MLRFSVFGSFAFHKHALISGKLNLNNYRIQFSNRFSNLKETDKFEVKKNSPKSPNPEQVFDASSALKKISHFVWPNVIKMLDI